VSFGNQSNKADTAAFSASRIHNLQSATWGSKQRHHDHVLLHIDNARVHDRWDPLIQRQTGEALKPVARAMLGHLHAHESEPAGKKMANHYRHHSCGGAERTGSFNARPRAHVFGLRAETFLSELSSKERLDPSGIEGISLAGSPNTHCSKEHSLCKSGWNVVVYVHNCQCVWTALTQTRSHFMCIHAISWI